MPSLTKYYVFTEDLAEKVHNLGSDTLKVVLSNTAPDLTDTDLASVGEITAQNGYAAGGHQASQVSSAQTNGLYKLVVNDVEITASGGSFGPFRYVILINSTANRVIGYYDYGSSISINNGEKFTTDFDGTNGVLQIP